MYPWLVWSNVGPIVIALETVLAPFPSVPSTHPPPVLQWDRVHQRMMIQPSPAIRFGQGAGRSSEVSHTVTLHAHFPLHLSTRWPRWATGWYSRQSFRCCSRGVVRNFTMTSASRLILHFSRWRLSPTHLRRLRGRWIEDAYGEPSPPPAFWRRLCGQPLGQSLAKLLDDVYPPVVETLRGTLRGARRGGSGYR